MTVRRFVNLLAVAYSVVFVPAISNAAQPIPQNAAKLEALRKARRDWFASLTVEAYEKVGRRSENWDEHARKALTAISRHWAAPLSVAEMENMRIADESAAAAIAAGCDDPLVLYVAATSNYRFIQTPPPRDALEMAEKLAASAYPAKLRFWALTQAVKLLPVSSGRDAPSRFEPARRLSDHALSLLPEAVRDVNPAVEAVLISSVLDACNLSAAGQQEFKDFRSRLEKKLEGAATPELRMLIEGYLDLHETRLTTALHGRWDGTYFFMKPQFDAEQLAAAAARFERVWSAAPGNGAAAAGRLLTAVGLGSDRATIETWFRRALEADGDSVRSCYARLVYESPKWYGSLESHLEFGRACAKTENWHAALPFLLITAHNGLAEALRVPEHRRKPETIADLNSVFAALMAAHPNDYATTLYFRQSARNRLESDASERLAKLSTPWKPFFLNEKSFQAAIADNRRLAANAVRQRERPAHARSWLTAAIPQNMTAQAQSRKARLDFWHAVTVDAYDRVGARSPKWNSAARRALTAMARHWAAPYSPIEMDQLKVASEASNQALAAGCTDPLIICIAESLDYKSGKEVERPIVRARALDAVFHLADSPYHVFVKWNLLANAHAEQLAREGTTRRDLPQAGITIDRAIALMPDVVRGLDPAVRSEFMRGVHSLLRLAELAEQSFEEVSGRLRSQLEKTAPVELQRLVEGYLLLRSSQFTRGLGTHWQRDPLLRHAVSMAKVREAQSCFEGVLQTRPNDALALTGMLVAAIAQDSQPEVVENWFRRALEADGDNFEACYFQWVHLSRMKDVDDEIPLAFGRACLRTGNWTAGLPYLLLNAHRKILRQPGDAVQAQAQAQADLYAIFTAFSETHPDGSFGPTYFYFRATEWRWKDANEILASTRERPFLALLDDERDIARLESAKARLSNAARQRIMTREKPSPDDAASGEPDIPQDAQKLARLRAARLAFHRSQTVEAYERVGRKSPKWDEPARRALEAYANVGSQRLSMLLPDQWLIVEESCRQAIAAGCDDPLILYLSIRQPNRYGTDKLSPDRPRALVERADALARSEYPPLLRASALQWATFTSSRLSREVSARIDEVLRLFEIALPGADREAKREIKRIFTALLLQFAKTRAVTVNGNKQLELGPPGHAKARDDVLIIQEQVEELLRKRPEHQSLQLLLQSVCGTHQIWRVHSRKDTPSVFDGSKNLIQHLKSAEDALERAWKLDPDNPDIAVEMLVVARGLGYDREKMEVWFRRAMEADGDCIEACEEKLLYLQPRWHGNANLAESFARACLRTRNHHAGLPMLMFTYPELGGVGTVSWKVVLSVYKPFLEHYPDSVYVQTRYAVLCRQRGLNEVARVHMQRLGKNVWKPAFASEDGVEDCRAALGIK